MSKRLVAVGLFLCEQVIVEAGTRNVTPVNCFRRRGVDRFPSDVVPLVVFAILTDGLGQLHFELVLERLDTFEDVARYRFSLRFVDPLHEARCILRLRDCSFPVPGYYQVTLLADKELVAQRKFEVITRGTVS
jgi:hypothetical protein